MKLWPYITEDIMKTACSENCEKQIACKQKRPKHFYKWVESSVTGNGVLSYSPVIFLLAPLTGLSMSYVGGTYITGCSL